MDDLVLTLAEELEAIGDSEVVDAISEGADAEAILGKLLTSSRLIVIDEAQRLTDESDGKPKSTKIARILERLSRALGSSGRLLLLSSREFGASRWRERADIVTLNPFRPKEAQAYLTALLEKDGLVDAVPTERVADVASWLGGNPRAIRLLVSALRTESLDFLIGLAPEAWEARDREVSPRLLQEFETNVLTRAAEQLDEKTELFLRRLSVLRKPFPRPALEALAIGGVEMEASRDELLARYIVDFRTGFYHVHPIVRETLLARFPVAQRRNAHMVAGRYFAAAFRAKQMVGRPEALGARFVEARYHFTLAESEEDLRDIATHFEGHLRSQFNFVTPIPTEPQELEERIILLSALLKDRGAHGLEYHLARCLLARGLKNDARLALPHLRRSTGPKSPAAAWVLRIQVEAELIGTSDAEKVAREGIKLVPPTQNLFSLYQSAAEILAAAGKSEKAVALLREGIKIVPPTQSLSSLYQSAGKMLAGDGKSEEAVLLLREGIEVPNLGSPSSLYQSAAEILAGDGKWEEAVVLLREGIEIVPPTQNLFSLYQSAAEILAAAGKSEEAVVLLRRGIKIVPPTQNLFSLYQSAAEILAGDGKSEQAVTLLREGIAVPQLGSLSSLYQSAGEILAGDDKSEEAVALLREGIKVCNLGSLFSLYQAAAEILARDGKAEAAIALLREGTTRIGNRSNGYKLVENAILIAADFGRFELLHSLAMDPLQKVHLEVMKLMAAEQFQEAAVLAENGLGDRQYFLLSEQGAFAALAAGDVDSAKRIIEKPKIVDAKNSSASWLMGLIEIKNGNIDKSKQHLEIYLGARIDISTVSVALVINYWKISHAERKSALTYHFPRIPKSVSGLDHVLIRHALKASDKVGAEKAVAPAESGIAIMPEPEPEPEPVGPMPGGTPSAVSVLVVATEWSSGRGGLSTFNRQLCVALARAGARVSCLVLEAPAGEKAEAEALGVTLVEASRGLGLSDEQRLLETPEELKGASPDFLIGHGRITGPAAASLAKNHYPGARRLHFVHMAPDEIEPYKLDRSDQAGVRAEERTEIEEALGRTADRVVAVGPRLHGRYSTLFAGYSNVPTPIRFDPGFDVLNDGRRDPPEGDPWQILLLGRADDVQLKGLDTAASAVAMAAQDRARGLARLELVVRGAQTETMDTLRAQLLKEAEADNLGLIIRAFTVRDETLQADMRRASLVLMPSRAEGFGLVGAEAIVAGTPVLISAESGLGQLLQEVLTGEQAARIVVPMNGSAQQLRDRWAGNINRVLSDREASFQRAAEVRDFLASEKTWQRSVDALLGELVPE